MPRPYANVLASMLLAAAVLLAAPWHAVDPDTLANLAIGRFIVQHGSVPATDPFTFTDPARPYSNPEWLGDVLWYGVHQSAGEIGLVAFKVLLVSLAWILTQGLSWRASAFTRVGSLLMLVAALPACASRFVERNELHALWLIPVYALVLARIGRGWRWAGVLLALGVLWANLHSSFVMGWLLVGAALLDRFMDKGDAPHERRQLIVVLVLHPLLALASPLGIHNLDQLIDHARGAAVYSAMVTEWMPSDSQAGTGGQLVVLLIQVAGLVSFLPTVNRRKLGGMVLVASTLILAQRTPRFLPLAVLLSVPIIAANLAAWCKQRSPGFRRVGGLASVAAVLLLLATASLELAQQKKRPSVFDDSSANARLAHFLAQEAPPQSRLLNTYNPGPWLLWHAGTRLQIAIDPRNNLGAETLRRYKNEVWVDERAFQQEVQRFQVGLAMLDLYGDQRTGPGRFLDAAPDWHLVYLDGRYAVFARSTAANRDLIAAHGYRRVRARLAFEYLLGPVPIAGEERNPRDEAELAADLVLLRQQGPSLAAALAAYAELCRDGNPPPRLSEGPTAATEGAAHQLAEAMSHLPPSAHLFAYLATANGRAGNLSGSTQVKAAAETVFPGSAVLVALGIEIARLQGHTSEAQALLTKGKGHLLAEPELMPLLSNRPLTVVGWPDPMAGGR